MASVAMKAMMIDLTVRQVRFYFTHDSMPYKKKKIEGEEEKEKKRKRKIEVERERERKRRKNEERN